MQPRVYDEAVALSLMKVANPWHSELISAIETAITPEQKSAAIVESSAQLTFKLKADGLYLSESLCSYCPQEEIFDWSPAYDMDWPEAPNPATAPMLPLPFTAKELAAFMLDGAGVGILHAITDSGCASDEEAIHRHWGNHPRHRHTRDAIRDALQMLAEANQHVAPLDIQYQEKADELSEKYESTLNQLEAKITSKKNKEHLSQSLQTLRAEMSAAQETAKSRRHTWRKAMVHYLLAPSIKKKYTQVTRWTESEKQKLLDAKMKYGATKAAEMFGINTSRVRRILSEGTTKKKSLPTIDNCWTTSL